MAIKHKRAHFALQYGLHGSRAVPRLSTIQALREWLAFLETPLAQSAGKILCTLYEIELQRRGVK